MEKPLRFDRMSGLGAEQLDALEQRVSELLEKPWDQGNDRPKELTLREALVVTSGYMRQNIIEEVWAEIFDVDQSTISRYITFLTPLIDRPPARSSDPPRRRPRRPPGTRSPSSTAPYGRAGPGPASANCG